jgi:pectate lyase
MFLTLQGNLFERTAQRMPRASGRAFAHIVNNLFAFQPLRRQDGQPFTSSYAAVSLSGASLLVEHNWFGQLTRTSGRRPLAAWTISTPGALRMPHEGGARLRSIGNLAATNEIIDEAQPEAVFLPSYRTIESYLDFKRLGATVAGACVMRRSGPQGARTWDDRLCGG